MIRIDAICNPLTTEPSKSWPANAVAKFHYFNANGLIARAKAADDRAMDLYHRGLATGGFAVYLSVYSGTFADGVRELAMMKRTSWNKLHVSLSLLKRDVAQRERCCDDLETVGAFNLLAEEAQHA
jgi:hypothetical protein